MCLSWQASVRQVRLNDSDVIWSDCQLCDVLLHEEDVQVSGRKTSKYVMWGLKIGCILNKINKLKPVLKLDWCDKLYFIEIWVVFKMDLSQHPPSQDFAVYIDKEVKQLAD